MYCDPSCWFVGWLFGSFVNNRLTGWLAAGGRAINIAVALRAHAGNFNQSVNQSISVF